MSADDMPIPDNGTVTGRGDVPPVPKIKLAELLPGALGLKPICKEQNCPGASILGGVPAGVEQVSAEIRKSAGFVPPMESDPFGKMMRPAVLFVTLTAKLVAACPTGVFPKVRGEGFRVI